MKIDPLTRPKNEMSSIKNSKNLYQTEPFQNSVRQSNLFSIHPQACIHDMDVQHSQKLVKH